MKSAIPLTGSPARAIPVAGTEQTRKNHASDVDAQIAYPRRPGRSDFVAPTVPRACIQ